MKVLFVNTSDSTGGAAVAATRLMKALQGYGLEVSLLCRDRNTSFNRKDVISLNAGLYAKAKFVAERLDILIHNHLSREGLWAIDTGRIGNDITRLKAFREADLIHLHWVNQAMLSLSDIQLILRSGKPVVWTLHDMWPFTGICHQADQCRHWQSGCGNCPLLKRPSPDDLSAKVYRQKVAIYNKQNFTAVGCSRWLAELAASAPLFEGKTVANIANPIDTNYYIPAGCEGVAERGAIRRELGLPADDRLLFFTAYNVADSKKGIDYFVEAVNLLIAEYPELKKKISVVLAGKNANRFADSFPVKVYSMGYVSDAERMKQLYQSVDLLVMPTLADNLPNTIVEAMACGVPSVAFAVGGVPSMIDNGVNGYLVRPEMSLDLSEAIRRALSTDSYSALCRNARIKAVSTYSEPEVARQYYQLYQQALNRLNAPA